PADVEELETLLGPRQRNQRVIAMPGVDSKVPIWLLGSSLFSAQLAAAKGLPYAFASHFAPRFMHQAIKLYRDHFQPSEVLDKPYRSEEHTSELQSRENLVCRLLLEKKKNIY